MARQGFTLTELLIALALLVALAGLAVPYLAGRLEPMHADAVREQAGSAIALCRLDAMRSGRPVRLVAQANADGRLELVGLPLDDAGARSEAAPDSDSTVLEAMDAASESERGPSDPGGRTGARTKGGDSGPPEDAGGRRGAERGAAGRRYMTLPEGYELSRREPAPEEFASGAAGRGGSPRRDWTPAEIPEQSAGEPGSGAERLGDAPPERDGSGSDPGSRRTTLGVFLPDGSAIVGAPVFVRRDGEPVARWTINPWSGALSSEPVTPPDEREADRAPDGDGRPGDGTAGEGGGEGPDSGGPRPGAPSGDEEVPDP